MIAVPEPICSPCIENLEIDDPLRAAAAEIAEADWKRFSNNRDLGTNATNILSDGMEMEDSIFASQLLTSSGCSLIEGTPTNVTPTKEEAENLISGRREKLQVRNTEKKCVAWERRIIIRFEFLSDKY